MSERGEWFQKTDVLVRLTFLGVAISLAGCTTPMFTMPPGPREYRVGFHDGCDAGYAYAGSPFYEPIAVPPAAPRTEPYRSGWISGFGECAGNYQHIQKTVNFLLGPP
jgi:hypothetical protein